MKILIVKETEKKEEDFSLKDKSTDFFPINDSVL